MNTNVGNRRWWALGALSLAVVAAGLDATVLSLALPTLATALHASESELQWFTVAYTLVLAVAMLPAGLLGDRYGRKKILMASLFLFGVGSVACAYSTSSGFFIAARVLLGIAGAGLITMCLSALTVLFSKEEQPKAVGVWAAANFLSLPLGPLLGGWLLTHYWWGWVFLLNVPVVLLGLGALFALLPESRAEVRPRLDVVGIAASSAGLGVLTYGLIRAGRDGWSNTGALVFLFGGLLIVAAFLWWERRLSRRPGGVPLVDLSLFRHRSFTWGSILAGVCVMAMFGVLFTLPQYFTAILGTTAQGAGLRLLPLIGGLVIGAVLASRLAAHVGPKFTLAFGFLLLTAGLLLGATTGVTSGDKAVLVWTAVCGAGMGFGLSTAATAALSHLTPERSGVGSAVMQAVNKLGGPLGAAILGSVLNASYVAHLDLTGLPPALAETAGRSVFAGMAVAGQTNSVTLMSSVQASFISGMDASLIVAAIIASAGIVLALIFMPLRAGMAAKNRKPPV